MTDKITISMSEVVRYRRTFTIDELAAHLGISPQAAFKRDEVLNRLDVSNTTYGLASGEGGEGEDDETLLDLLVPPGGATQFIDSVEDREWGVS